MLVETLNYELGHEGLIVTYECLDSKWKSLRCYIDGLKDLPKAEDEILDMFSKVLIALLIIHKIDIVHGDFRPENIFYDENFAIKIGGVTIDKLKLSIKEMFLKRSQTMVLDEPV